MTDEQREELKRLALVASQAAQRHHWAGYQNSPMDSEKAAEQSAHYELLGAEAREARYALEAAITALGKPAEPWVRALATEMIDAARIAAEIARSAAPALPQLYESGENSFPWSRKIRQAFSR